MDHSADIFAKSIQIRRRRRFFGFVHMVGATLLMLVGSGWSHLIGAFYGLPDLAVTGVALVPLTLDLLFYIGLLNRRSVSISFHEARQTWRAAAAMRCRALLLRSARSGRKEPCGPMQPCGEME